CRALMAQAQIVARHPKPFLHSFHGRAHSPGSHQCFERRPDSLVFRISRTEHAMFPDGAKRVHFAPCLFQTMLRRLLLSLLLLLLVATATLNWLLSRHPQLEPYEDLFWPAVEAQSEP